MSSLLPPKSLKAAPFVPTAPRSGELGDFLFRGANMFLKGRAPFRYLECYSGHLDLSETIPTSDLTGTLTLNANSKTVSGTGTLFLSELHLGQFVLANGELLVVDRLVAQDSFITARAPVSNASGITGTRLPVIFEMDKLRGTLLRGNAVKTDKGNILCVGDGILRVDGSSLSSPLSASRRAKIAIYDPATNTYSIYTLGMDTPLAPALSSVPGGTKNMQAGLYSIRIVPGREATNGYNNPSEKAEITIAAGEKIRIPFGAMDTTNGQSTWLVFGTLYTPQQGIQGPWYYVRTLTTADVPAIGGSYDTEWLDAEISRNDLLETNNDAPVDAEFIAYVAGFPVYVSCQGQGYSSVVKSTSPGPMIVPAKPKNIDAAPLDFAVPLSPPETIVGYVEALGRLYLPTTNRLQFAQFSGLEDFPVTARAFWKTGFQNPYQLIFVNDRLYGYSGGSPTRSIADGDEGSEEHEWANSVVELTRNWTPHHVLVAHDPHNNAVCFFHSADSLNDSGYWKTVCLPYMLDQGEWGLPIVIESTTQDMIVSGVATVNGHLEFLAGGGTSGSSIAVGTYRFDELSGEEVFGYAAWGFSDDGDEIHPKQFKYFEATGRFQNATIGVFGYRKTESVPISGLEAGNSSSLIGAFALPDSTTVITTQMYEVKVKNLKAYTVRLEFRWDGTGEKVRFDEVVTQASLDGARG